ncbi:phosphoribosyltransferase-like protein [Chryseobacterium kwangjuense]|uniref:Uncharacterized protein n=1 Tax=Chryseobacterium kwangjuense TaxID=267125 RepID=A0A135W6A6_9FLAO|nr:ATP-binding protein [Chryseobacterium kwangjuense]KXH80470.1 hypothetical protein AU378_18910 [Chryseobacterium kwangjuense]
MTSNETSVKIDNLITEKQDSKNYLKNLSILVQELYNIQELTYNEEYLFRKENNIEIQRFVAVSFLRILSSCNADHIENSKQRMLGFIQVSLPELKTILKITDKTKNFEIEKIFKNFVREREEELKEHLVFSGKKISDIISFQQKFRGTVNNKSQIIIKTVCSDLVKTSTLNEIFRSIESFVDSDEESRYENYQQVITVLNTYLSTVEYNGTKYAREIFHPSFTSLKQLITKEIEKSPYVLPADIDVRSTEKKYPFINGSKNFISLIVTNYGAGFANKVKITIKDYNSNEISLHHKFRYLGSLKVESISVDFQYECLKTFHNTSIDLEVKWKDLKNDQHKIKKTINLVAQNVNINWEEIQFKKPYNLEPVENNSDLIGREIILNNLKNTISSPVGSSYIYGQRRVGKTSIVKTLQNSFSNSDLLIIYIEAGDWNDAKDPFKSMKNLGERIVKKIKKYSSKFQHLEIPKFEESFNLLTDFLEDVTDIDPNFRCLIILDEFDRISSSLYERGDIAKSFTLTLRSISNRANFGFILVGGEKMEHILSQWQEFNKFSPIRVDYFTKERDWEDFIKLITKPVENILEVSESAITHIYEETAGNPYFTKKICMELFSNMINNRDIHVTEKEAIKASTIARNSANIGATDFSHFWEDGIKGTVEKEEEVSLMRRKLLIVLSQLLINEKNLDKQTIKDAGSEVGLKDYDIDKYLLEFEQRKILQSEDNVYYFVVIFFKEWLISGGKDKIIATFDEEERVILQQKIEENLSVKTEEIDLILKRIEVYKSKKITINDIRNWLNQFEEVQDQRLMFKLLQNFKLYSELEVRLKLQNIFSLVIKDFIKRNLERVLEHAKRKRDDILVTYIDQSPGKGSSYYTKLFADENNLYTDLICVPEMIQAKIKEKISIRGLVIIDDFIGSGRTIVENFEAYFIDDLINLVKNRKITIYICAITGFLESKESILQKLTKFNLDIEILIVDILDNTDKCFDANSKIFENHLEHKKAKEICLQKGEILVQKNPLGFSNGETLIAFPINCPNNTLPIFWKKTKTWQPLFERTS